MDDLTPAFRSYRECARLVWNMFLREYGDGERDFEPIDTALLEGMLLSQLQCYREPKKLSGRIYYGSLKLLPVVNAGVKVLCGQEFESTFHWTPELWIQEAASLHFSSLFDFVTFSGNWREFRYVEALVTSTSISSFEVGRRILVEVDAICVIDDSQSQ